MRSREFVYCLHRCANGDWLLLNRRYRPFDHASDGPVDFDTCDGYRVELTPDEVRAVDGGAIPYHEGDERVWLFHDGTRPDSNASARRAYERRMTVLGFGAGEHEDVSVGFGMSEDEEDGEI